MPTSEQPSATTSEPPVATTELPPATSEQRSAATIEPPLATTEPLSAASTEPPVATTEPPTDVEPSRKFASNARCGPRLTRADLDFGIELGGRYLLSAQRPEGNFVSEVDWTTGEVSPGDNAVRQAGSTWGMALLYRETRDPAHRAALDRALVRWDSDARTVDGRRWQAQHGARRGRLRAVALIGTSLLDRLAAPEGLADPAATRASLDALCTFIEGTRLPDGGFGGIYNPEAGTHSDSADPYSSGESLLLLTRCGLELGDPDRVARALAWAEEDYDKFVAKPLAKEPDPDLSKAYYQWSSMSWFALADAGHESEKWGRRLIEQAIWMVNVHRTLTRSSNTGYAYEGIVPAWEWARRTGDDQTAGKLACVIHQGLRKLCSWQLGHPLASAALRSAPTRFHGAVQNHAKEPTLRIGVTQHQVHALIIARRFRVDEAEHLCDATAQVPTEMTSPPPAEETGRYTVTPRAAVTEVCPVRGKERAWLASLVFLGDTSMGDTYLARNSLGDAFHRLKNDPWSFIELLAPLVEDNSLLIANLETVLAESPPDPFSGKKGFQGWDHPQRTVSILQRMGVDAVSLANNHTMDYGASPLLATIAHLKAAGIHVLGAGSHGAEAAEPLSLAAPFGNLHVFAGFEFRASYESEWDFYASNDAPGVNPLWNGVMPDVSAAVAHTRSADPSSAIIVYPHWGGNTNNKWSNDEMIDLNKKFLSAGADLVIGHGAHRMQEIIAGPDGTSVFSLGNFVFNSPSRYGKLDQPPFSLVARLDLAQQGSGITGGFRLYPIVSDNLETGFRPRPVREPEAVEVYNLLAGRSDEGFPENFALEQDGRGWYLTRTTPLSPRLATAGGVVASVATPRLAGAGACRPPADTARPASATSVSEPASAARPASAVAVSAPDDAASQDSLPRDQGWTAKDLADITGGNWETVPPEGWSMTALAYSSKRRLPQQALVIPRCRTYRFGFSAKNLRKLSGNGYAILTDDTPLELAPEIPLLRVTSVSKAVASLAVASRTKFPGRIVAITGSAGKSTTCNMIEDLLYVFGVPKRWIWNFNIYDSVNSEVANLTNERVAVIEVAASYLMRPRPDIIQPDVALITNIGESHLEKFDSTERIAAVKSHIFDLMPCGTAVIPRDDDFYDYMVQRARQAGAITVSFGANPDADARLLSYSAADGLIEAEIFGEKITYQLGVRGRHFASNSVGALAVISVLGMDWRRAAVGLSASREITGRGAAIDLEIGNSTYTLIDDTYNANPTSMRAALEMLSHRPVSKGGRRIAVLSDMLELGPNTADFHIAMAEPILQCGADSVYLVGPQMRAVWDIVKSRVRGGHTEDINNLWTMLESQIAEGDVVLFKGSHGTDLHQVVATITELGKRVSPDPESAGANVEAAVPSASTPRRRDQTQLDDIALSAEAALVLKIPSAGVPQIVFAKNPHDTFPPASLTKLLTAVTALNVASWFGKSLDTILEMNAEDRDAGSGKNISAGDRFSLQDAIANMMLPSSNATANVVARTLGQLLVNRDQSLVSPVRRFVQEMNATAISLRMTNSTFVRPDGRYASGQFTTAGDMVKLLAHAAGRPPIRRVWGRAAYTMKIAGPNARTQQITSSVKMVEDDNVLGGKTGTHNRVSKTTNLAIYSQTPSGTKLASVILHSASDQARYADMRLLTSAFDDV